MARFTKKELGAIVHALGNVDPSDLDDYDVDPQAIESAEQKAREMLAKRNLEGDRQ